MITAQTRVTLGDSILGTPEYMSPEQARGDEHIDHRADLYSAGVVLYEMLTGRTPFRADTPSAVIHQILNTDAPEPRTFNQGVDPVLASLALRLMAKEPGNRLASAKEALTALETGERVQVPAPRRPRRGLILAGLAFVVVSVWVLSWDRLRRWLGGAAPGDGAAPVIVDVWTGDPDVTNIWAKYADGTTSLFHQFPREVETAHAELVHLAGNGSLAVAAALVAPLAGESLFLFDADGTERWPMDLSDERQWPDCGPPTQWNCRRLAAANLDAEPGEELLAVAGDKNRYPTRISIIDPRTQEVRSTFRHPGGISGLRIEEDFFRGHRPAILAWGYNNLLYCADDNLRVERVRLADWTLVSVMMVLDPNAMDGMGPACGEVIPGVPPAVPYAYAFLNLPGTSATVYAGGGTDRARQT